MLELEMALNMLDRENAGLKSQARSQHASLNEQIEATENYRKRVELQSEEMKGLQSNVTSLEDDIASKNEEIKELKDKLGKYKREIDEHKEENDKFKRRLDYFEDELSKSREDKGKVQVELERFKEENRLGKILLTKEENVNQEGRGLVKKLRREKQKIWAELQKVSRREGDINSFQKTLTEVLDKSSKQVGTIQNLFTNMTMQKAQYDHIVDYYITSYNDLFQEFKRIHDIYNEEYELKEATADSPATLSIYYDRSADILRVECNDKFNELEKLSNEFTILIDNNR